MTLEADALLTPGAVLEPPLRVPGPTAPEGRRPPPARRIRWRRGLEIAIPCLVAAVLCLIELGTRSLWLDEGATVSIVSQHGAALWRGIAHDGGNMLVYYVFMHVLVSLFGDGAALIRIPSVIATVATVGITGMIGGRLFDRRVAFAAAMLTAVSLPLVFWGQDARAYAPLVTFCAASFLAFIVISDGEDRPSWWLIAAWVLSTVLAIYMGFVAALVLPAQLLLLRRRVHLRRVLVGVVGTGLACLPLLALATARGSSQLFWVPAPNRKVIGQTARWLTSAGLPPNFHHTATSAVTLYVTAAVLLVGLGIVVRRGLTAYRTRTLTRDTWAILLVVSWLVVPVVLSIGEGKLGQPILLFRNAVICLPAVGLGLAWVLLRTRLPVWLGWAAVAGLLALRALQLAPSYGVSPENWKAAEHYVSSHVRPGDCIAFYPLDGRMAFDYYVRGGEDANGMLATIGPRVRVPRPVDPTTPWDSNPPFVENYSTPSNARLTQIERGCTRLWFVVSHQGQAGGPPGSHFNYIRYRVLGATLQVVYTSHHKRKFGWASPVQVELLSGRQLPHH